MLLCVTILVVWTVWGNKALMVSTISISSSRIPAAFSGFRIALCFAQESVKIAPTYYVTGNHEAACSQYGDLKAGLEEAGVIVLEDGAVSLDRNGEIIALLGLDDPDFTVKGNIIQTRKQ